MLISNCPAQHTSEMELGDIMKQELMERMEKYYIRGRYKSYWNIVADRGQGPYLFDSEGRKYLDYVMGGGPLILGHCHPSVTKAVNEQIGQGSQFYIANRLGIELAEELCKASRCSDKALFTVSGTEAVMLALRIVRAFTGKDKILRFEGSFNGFSDEMMRSSSLANQSKLKDYPQSTCDSEGIPKATETTILVAPYNNIEITKRIIDENEEDLAGVIAEPIQRLLVPNPNFLRDLRNVTARKNIPLIFDEVVTGFRVAYGGAQELYGVVPDLATYGKILGGGFPMGAVGGKDEIMVVNTEKSGYKVASIGTFSGHPVGCAAGLATLTELRKKGTYESLRRYGERLRDGLKRVFDENGVAAQVLGVGSMSGYAFTENSVTDFRSWISGDKAFDEILNAELIRNNLLIDVPKVYSSTAHGEKELEKTVDIYNRSVKAAVEERQKFKRTG